MPLHFVPLPTDHVHALRNGGKDAYGNAPEDRISDGNGNSCRHCLKKIPEGEPYFVVAHRPFSSLQPYAETGPLFVCQKPCEPAVPEKKIPEILDAESYIVRGYDADERIIYGTGAVVPTPDIPGYAMRLFADNEAIAFIHVRSAANNCYQCRIDRA